MASLRFKPLAFSPAPVVLLTLIVYLALLIPVTVIHNVAPTAPRTSPVGLDLTQAWSDLQFLSTGFHPYNSHRNDQIHAWLLERINGIIHLKHAQDKMLSVHVFDDNRSNLTFPGGLRGDTDVAVYFEGTNIIVYIRGEEDDVDNWWEISEREPRGKGVLVNAHYDSVSTGFGATDDGVGVVTCLQLLQYFTSSGHTPRKGLVVMFNNGEEDSLNGAYAYSQHPMSKFTRTFLNLEGAGAGGRATLFRSTDMGVTRSYMNVKHPFGSILSANGFQTGLIRSQTDYVVFEELGLRGLDVAFMEPRSRYHTDQDDAKHTSINSLWHMLSAAIATTEGLVSADGRRESGIQSVWFDVFGSSFVLFQAHTLFALSVTLLVATPLVLLSTSIVLYKMDKMYLFRSSVNIDGKMKAGLRGWRGFFRFPALFITPTGVSVGLAFLLTKTNPYIVHSSGYAVWAMMISAWIFLAWFVSRVADFARPSAFHRAYTLTWMFTLMWVLLVVATVYENKFGIAGGYFVFFCYVGTSLATWISYLELLSLPRKSDYAAQFMTSEPRHENRQILEGEENVEEEPTETTSLLRGQQTTFANYRPEEIDGKEPDPSVYGDEQQWSSHLPKWTWALQFIFVAPIVLILVAPLALLTTSAIHQTGQDGSPSLFIYICIAAFTTFLLTPLLPFIHRYTYQVPVFLLFVFIGTLIYNTVAFPFSESNRLKLFFRQDLDLNTFETNASLTGVSPYVSIAVRSLPSAANKDISCAPLGDRVQCRWPGIFPHLAPNLSSSSSSSMANLLSLSINKTHPEQAQIRISGKNTRACKLSFDTPVHFSVENSVIDPRFPLPTEGAREINLWSRTWESTWTVNLEWQQRQHQQALPLSGRATCLWSDNNAEGVIPALDEIRRHAPAWVAVTKLSSGLVEGSKRFVIE